MITLLLSEPNSIKNEYGYISFTGYFQIGNEQIAFYISTSLEKIFFIGTSEEAIFLLENEPIIIKEFIDCFRKFYKNRVNDFYIKKGRYKGYLKKHNWQLNI